MDVRMHIKVDGGINTVTIQISMGFTWKAVTRLMLMAWTGIIGMVFITRLELQKWKSEDSRHSFVVWAGYGSGFHEEYMLCEEKQCVFNIKKTQCFCSHTHRFQTKITFCLFYILYMAFLIYFSQFGVFKHI